MESMRSVRLMRSMGWRMSVSLMWSVWLERFFLRAKRKETLEVAGIVGYILRLCSIKSGEAV